MLTKREMAIQILKAKYNTKSFNENAFVWKRRINRMMKKSKEELIYANEIAIKVINQKEN